MVRDTKELPAAIGEAKKAANGVLSHTVVSPLQGAETTIHVLCPEHPRAGATYRTLYLLPVAPKDSRPWGDAMAECVEHGLHNEHQLICVLATFSHMPWYADHPTDPRIRQESYFLKVVVPFIEQTYPVSRSSVGRLLLGFSKSGWGAYSLLLRHPDVFFRAAAWDAPLGQQSPNKYGMREVFPTQASLDPYCIWELLTARTELLIAKTRLSLLGYGVFRGHHQATHCHLQRLGIPHDYEDGPRREHHWNSGWVPKAVELLASDAED